MNVNQRTKKSKCFKFHTSPCIEYFTFFFFNYGQETFYKQFHFNQVTFNQDKENGKSI